MGKGSLSRSVSGNRIWGPLVLYHMALLKREDAENGGHFILIENELEGLAKTIRIKSTSCCSQQMNSHPRWAIESFARYLIPCINCQGCEERGQQSYPSSYRAAGAA